MPCEVDWASPKRFSTKKQRVDLLQESQEYGDGKKRVAPRGDSNSVPFARRASARLRRAARDAATAPRYTLEEYKTMADAFAKTWMATKHAATPPAGGGLGSDDATFETLEDDYWNAVDNGASSASGLLCARGPRRD